MSTAPMLRLDITGDDADPVRVDVRMRDVLAWERRFPGRAVNQLGEDKLKASSLYELAWLVMARQGYQGSLADFQAGYDVVPVADDDPELPDPTPAGPSGGP